MTSIDEIITEVVNNNISQERAIEIADSEWWNDATDLQIAYIQLHQDRLICDFYRFHQACERVIGSPIQSISFGIRQSVDAITKIVDEKYME